MTRAYKRVTWLPDSTPEPEQPTEPLGPCDHCQLGDCHLCTGVGCYRCRNDAHNRKHGFAATGSTDG